MKILIENMMVFETLLEYQLNKQFGFVKNDCKIILQSLAIR